MLCQDLRAVRGPASRGGAASEYHLTQEEEGRHHQAVPDIQAEAAPTSSHLATAALDCHHPQALALGHLVRQEARRQAVLEEGAAAPTHTC